MRLYRETDTVCYGELKQMFSYPSGRCMSHGYRCVRMRVQLGILVNTLTANPQAERKSIISMESNRRRNSIHRIWLSSLGFHVSIS